MCPMSCHPTLCGMLATVLDGRLVALAGDPDNPDSRGFLCVRGRAAGEVIGNPARLLHPLVRDRRSDPFRRASWDEAMERIAAGMADPSAVGILPGHGTFATSYGTRIGAQLLARLAGFHGCHSWSPTMLCWGLGAFGLGLTGILESHTPDDLAASPELVVLWGVDLASQPNTARPLDAARRRGARVVAIDVRRNAATAKADEVLIVRPGTDSALALALLHVLCAEGLHDAAFVERHTVGFEALAAHVARFTPAWAEAVTGVPANAIAALARRYAGTRPAMIVLGGSSMHKGGNGWQAARAISCLPAVTGNLGVPGGGFGPRHGSAAHGRGLGDLAGPPRRRPERPIPSQMAAVTAALGEGRIRTLLLMGTDLLSSFADSGAVARGLERTGLVVCHDLFLNGTARRTADVVLPGTAWLEELGCKATHAHLTLVDRVLPPAGEARSLYAVVTDLAARLGLEGFHPWSSEEAMVDAVLDHPSTGHATVAALRAEGGSRALRVSPVAYPTLRFDTPSGKVELFSARALELGLPPLPAWEEPPADAAYPLVLAHGRTMDHFHAFYESGRALPSLARREVGPTLWVSPDDARARGLADGSAITVLNGRGELAALVRVTSRVPAGTVWMHDGWSGLNTLTGGAPVLPDAAVDLFPFSAGQAGYGARVEVVARSG